VKAASPTLFSIGPASLNTIVDGVNVDSPAKTP
jgi:hypothetical protein